MKRVGSISLCEPHPEPVDPDAERLLGMASALLDGMTHYRSLGVLGSGSSGVVLHALDTRADPPTEVAVKLIPRGEFVRDYKTYLKREIVHTASLKHPAIITLREAFMTPDYLGIAMEYARGGDLHGYLNARPGFRLSEGEARWLFQQLAIGLQFCHARGVSNRDLKLENLLLVDAAAPRPVLKICDFGYSKHEDNSSAKSGVGTTAYMAPEVVLGAYSPYNAKAVDVWAAGVVLYTMVYGSYPFDPASPAFSRCVVEAHCPPPPGVLVSPPCVDLLARLLHPKCEARASMDEVAQHPWFLEDLPAGALHMNAALAAHAARSAEADAARGAEMAVAVDALVDAASAAAAPGEAALRSVAL